MYNNKKLKKLAHLATETNHVPDDISEFVQKCLSKKELKEFLFYYKLALAEKRVYIFSPLPLSEMDMRALKDIYKDKEILSVIDKTLGGGLKIKENDMIVDFTFKNYINDTIEKLKN